MRLITVRGPQGEGEVIAKLAFEMGVKEAAISQAKVLQSNEAQTTQDVVDIQTATPIAKKFIEALMAASFYNPATYSLTVRHPQSIFGSKPPVEEVHPVIIPSTDVYEDLYQFTKVTVSLVGRVFLSALLLSYGLVEDQMPIIIAGLLFLPYHHHMLAIALGGCIREWRFVKQGAFALLVTTALIFFAGMCVALVTEGPVQYDKFGTPLSGAVIAMAIGIAAALGTLDDAGRKELIGLAAAAHISIYPAWFGLKTVFGMSGSYEAIDHLFAFLINLLVLIFSAGIVYAIAGMRGDGIRRFISGLNNKS
jgi:hypothetical protein